MKHGTRKLSGRLTDCGDLGVIKNVGEKTRSEDHLVMQFKQFMFRQTPGLTFSLSPSLAKSTNSSRNRKPKQISALWRELENVIISVSHKPVQAQPVAHGKKGGAHAQIRKILLVCSTNHPTSRYSRHREKLGGSKNYIQEESPGIK
ncbi:hypothetical protein ElyMa_003979900 [Elysia marginata]|uniref:Uncharacterized protein n=1 Tax=Elysia marginata TaxID=1093978 RepID=A0AAV4FYW4_9GAST|nr:hypothetical protein ElyMa_003979900 [Elysia marginata]